MKKKKLIEKEKNMKTFQDLYDSTLPAPAAAPALGFCTQCGQPLETGARFCPKCGQAITGEQE